MHFDDILTLHLNETKGRAPGRDSGTLGEVFNVRLAKYSEKKCGDSLGTRSILSVLLMQEMNNKIPAL